MRVARVLVWLLPCLVVAMGVGFLIWSVAQSGVADAYRNAPQCAMQATSGCYQVVPGRIASVQVSQGRDGERDRVTIDTSSQGTLTATLEPSAAAAPHVRSGAEVTVKLYGGQVTLVMVDGLNVASTANPDANQSNTAFDGWLLIALGLASAAFSFFTRWRFARRPAGATGGAGMSDPALQELLPSGEIGWSVRPKQGAASLVRYLAVAGLLVGMTLPAVFDPSRKGWAILLDSVVIGGIVVLVGLFRRNARVFADTRMVGKTDIFGRTRKFDLHDIARADRFMVSGGSAANRHLVFVTSAGGKAFEVAGPFWDYAQLDRLCASAGIRLSGSYLDVVGALKVNGRVRGALGWSQAWVGLGLVVFIIAFALVLAGPTTR